MTQELPDDVMILQTEECSRFRGPTGFEDGFLHSFDCTAISGQ